jgi:hypothetical protein
VGSQTPIFALRYPYQSENVDPAHFKNLADDIDAALDLIDTRAGLVLNKPALNMEQSTDATGVASGATAIITWDTVDYNPNGWWNAGAPTLIALPAGIYMVAVSLSNLSGTATGLDEQAIDIQVNSVSYSRKTMSLVAGVGSVPMGHHALVYTATPQNLRVTWSWWGTSGTATLQSSEITVRQVRDL